MTGWKIGGKNGWRVPANHGGAWQGPRPVRQRPDPMGHYLLTHRQCARCGEPATLVDHVIPHRGDESLLFNPSNWVASCRRCHSACRENASYGADHVSIAQRVAGPSQG